MSGLVETKPAILATPTIAAKPRTRLILASGFQPDYVREVANAYALTGHKIQLIGGDMHAGTRYAKGVEFLNLRGRDAKDRRKTEEFKKLARYYWRLLRHVGSSPSRVVYDVSIGRPFLRCVLMYSAFRMLGKRIIYTAHNVVPHDAPTLFNRVIYFFIYRALASAIVVHGQALKDRLISEFGVKAEKVHVVPHGTYHAPNDPAMTKAKARFKLGLPADAPVALIFGFQRPYKGTHFVLEALRETRIKGLILVIRGKATDAPYRKRLESLIERALDRYRINAHFEPVPDDEVELLFKAADIVLLPYFEGSQSGIKFMAYAYGRPVLASKIGSLAEFIQPSRTGEVFEPHDPVSFVQTLAYMFQNRHQYNEQRIRDIAYSQYSFEAAVQQIDAIYEHLTG
ncbi:MAG: hypothetical protein AMXMBFR4_23860 [Candidatus Hydrogenedentota bacterium]